MPSEPQLERASKMVWLIVGLIVIFCFLASCVGGVAWIGVAAYRQEQQRLEEEDWKEYDQKLKKWRQNGMQGEEPATPKRR